jgi:hypothetical protein
MTVRMRLPYGQKIETAERMENVASVSKRLSWTRGNKVDLPAATAQCNASGAPWQRVNCTERVPTRSKTPVAPYPHVVERSRSQDAC